MISGTTTLVGLLGQPVMHSVSPRMHNAALNSMRLDWCYLALPCPKNQLREILSALYAVNCQGLNITIPFKEKVSELCSDLSPLAKRLGAVNTLIRDKKGGWKGANTDVEGFIYPLTKKDKEWGGLNAVVIGCGGSARAVVAGLQQLKFSKIIVIGRQANRLSSFIKDLQEKTSLYNTESEHLSLKGFLQDDLSLTKEIETADLIINTTPIGMKTNQAEKSNENLIPLNNQIWKGLKNEAILYDLIYTPNPTPWLLWGETQGLKCINGLEMLIQQGASSLRLWSGVETIPTNLMRNAAEEALGLNPSSLNF